MKKQFYEWLSQGKIKKIIDELNKQHPDNQKIILISARYHKYLEDYHSGIKSISDSDLTYATLCNDLGRLIEDLHSDIQQQTATQPYPFLLGAESRSPELQIQIEAYYKCISDIICETKMFNLSKRQMQAMVKLSSSKIALFHFGTEKPPSYLDKPSMPPNTVISCNACYDKVRLKGNDQCPNCDLSTFAWMKD